MLANFLCLIHPATPSDVLTTTAYPLSSGTDVGEQQPRTIIHYRYHLLAATVCGVGSAVLIAMYVEVLPTLHGSLLGSFAHVVAPLLALVGRNVTF
jgi:hypothetical protein